MYETKVILPSEIDELRIDAGKDYITLVTCTPYGVNTHRLLVKACRTEYEPYVTSEDDKQIIGNVSTYNYFFIGILIGIAILFVLLVIRLFAYRK